MLVYFYEYIFLFNNGIFLVPIINKKIYFVIFPINLIDKAIFEYNYFCIFIIFKKYLN